MASVPLPLMGGLFTEAQATDLPPGASPLVINDDFIVGSVYPRPGKKSVYTQQVTPGVGFLRSAVVTITSAQLKDLAANPVTLVPAPGPGLVYTPVMTAQIYNFGTTPYTVDFPGAQSVTMGSQDWLDADLTENYSRAAFWPNDFLEDNISDIVNQPVILTNFGGNDLVDGDGSLTVLILYILVDTATGEIVPTDNPTLIKSKAVTITSSQLLSLRESPIEILPAPGAGLANVPVLSAMEYTFVTTPYTIPANMRTELAWPSDGRTGLFNPIWIDTAAGTDPPNPPTNPDILTVTHNAKVTTPTNFQYPSLDQINNQPVTLQNRRGTGDMTDGDGTLTVTAYYVTVNLQSGAIIGGDTGNVFAGNVLVSSPQILAGSAVQMIAAPGPGKTITPLVTTSVYQFGTTPYTLHSGSEFFSDPNITYAPLLASFLDNWWGLTSPGGNLQSIWDSGTNDYFNEPSTNMENQPAVWGMTAGGFATGGDGALALASLYVQLPPVGSAPPPSTPLVSFNYLKTFAQTDGDTRTLALDDTGTMWQEDVVNDPGVLEAVYTAIEPDSFAQSATEDDREFIAISNLLNGTDIPYTYDGTNFDRLSQVGPGAPPSAAPTSAGSDIVSITQHGAISLLTGNHDWLLVSDAPSDHGDFGTPATPGNVMSIVFRSATLVSTYIKPGTSIVLSGFPTINGNIVNNDPAGILAPKTYTVTSVGLPIPGQDSYDAIVFTVAFTTFYAQKTPPGCSVQSTVATLTAATQIPNLEVGGQFQIAGTGGSPPTGYDGADTVVDTPNASQLQITSTALSNNIATYAFNLISGALPAVGESVTIGETLNGDGIFNVVNAVIQTATAGSFTLQISAPPGTTILAAAESGFGIIFGTIFTFDAGEIVGNKTGGTIVTVGLIAAGIRKVCYSYVTRNGYVSKPSPVRQFDVPTGATGIAIANLLTGPGNVIRRIVHITAANGGNFYNIPIDVPFTDPVTGIVTVSKSTWVNDNSTTNVVLSFSDDALIAGLQIDIQGNNLFETAEVGSSVGFIPYAARVFAIGEQNKLTNWNNWSFDGGIGVIKSIDGGTLSYPAGWTLDPATGAGGGVSASPLFGNAYQISNLTGNPQAVWGQISQNMALDEFGVPIIAPSTTYSVRMTAAKLSGALGAGSIVVDLFSATLGVSLGTFSVLFANLGTTMLIFTGTLLTRTLAPVPSDLVIRLYGANMEAGDSVLIDRVEVFPSEQPNLSTEVTGSYVNDFEAFDQVTGVIGCAVQNQQAVKSAFTLYDSLYIVKEHSLLAVKDNESTEPQGWEPRVVSNAVGTTSIYGVTTGIDEANAGEEWAVIAGQPGAFLFNGGQPIKLTEEIQQLWNLINWKYGHTLWVKNDIVNRRILIGVPLKVPNKWFPTGLIANDSNPTTPNVILSLNYKQLNTAGALGERAGIRVSYSGKVIATEMVRKWSIWTIKSPCAAFITRPDTTSPLFLGNSDDTGKIYQLIDGEPDGLGTVQFVDGSGPLSDDGLPFPQLYDTYGFITEEQEGQYKMTSARKGYDYMWLNIDGGGELTLTVYPNTLDSPYAHILLPNLNLPGSTNGDLEYPLNETAARLFLQFKTFAVGAGFFLSQVTIAMRQDPWSQVRGRNI